MTDTISMPKLIENKKDLESLIPGEQVELDIFIGEDARLMELPNKMRKWGIDEAIYLNMHKTEFFTYNIPYPESSQKLKMLEEAGL